MDYLSLKKKMFGAFAVLLIFLGLLVRVQISKLDPGRIFTDSVSYVRVADAPLFGVDIWQGERPFTGPLMLKILGVSSDNFTTPEVLARIGQFQAILGGLSFGALGLSIASRLKQALLQLSTILVLQIFGFSIHVSQWDSLLLSESLATSLLPFAFSIWILYISTERPFSARLWNPILLIPVLLFSFLYSFTRDTNSFFLLAIASIGVMGALLFGRIKDAAWGRMLIVSGLLIGISIFHQININNSGRWRVPFYGTFLDRIYSLSYAREYFIEQGMPFGDWNEGVVSIMGRTDFIEKVNARDSAKDFVAWMDSEGRQTYAAFLLTYPATLLSGPINDYDKLLHPLSVEYRSFEAKTPVWLQYLSNVFYPLSNKGMIVIFVPSLALTIIAFLRGAVEPWLQCG